MRIFAWTGTAWTQRGNDIDGEFENDQSGSSVSLSSNGSILAIGADRNDDNGSLSGHVRVYAWTGAAWAQRGNDIEGEAAFDYSGATVSLSSDGSILAIGAEYNDGAATDAGHVRVYAWTGTAWAQRGNDIDGPSQAVALSGRGLSLSANGSTIAIGARYGDGILQRGQTSVYTWDDNTNSWSQKGNAIVGEANSDYSGQFVSLSADGSILAIGADNNDGGGTNSGHVRVFGWSGTQWLLLDRDLDGEAPFDNSGQVALSSTGSTVAIGAFRNGADRGHVRVYTLTDPP